MKRVFLEEYSEPFLRYLTAAQYQREAPAFVLPSDAATLLQNARELHLFLDELGAVIDTTIPDESARRASDRYAFLDETRSDSGYSTEEMQRLCTTLWHWCSDVRQRHAVGVTLVSVNRFYYWLAFARCFRLSVANSAEKHAAYTLGTTEESAYYGEVSARYNIQVCGEPLGALSITQLWNSIRLVFHSLYAYAYSPAQRHYVHALFYRYCVLIDCEQPDADPFIFDDARFVVEHDDGVEAPPEEVANTRALIEAFPQQRIRVSERLSLSHGFVREGEKLFYHQLYRLRLSGRMQARPVFALPYLDARERHRLLAAGLDGWRAFVLEVAESKKLRHFVLDAQDGFKASLVGVHMYHGERERYCEANPDQADSDREVLMELRPNDLIEINRVHALTVRSIVDIFYTETRQQCFGGEQRDEAQIDFTACERPFPAPLHERESLLLTRICAHVWFTVSGHTQAGRMRESCVFEELCTLESIDRLQCDWAQTTQRKSYVPTLLRLQRLYYVTLPTRRVFSTHLFIEALLVWLALWVRDAATRPCAAARRRWHSRSLKSSCY